MEKVRAFVNGDEHVDLYFTQIFHENDITALNKKLNDIEFSKTVVNELIEIRTKQLECNELISVLENIPNRN